MKMSSVDLGKRLLEAAGNGRDDEVRMLMARGAPFTTDWLGISPLHLAAQYGYYSTAEVLLRAGACRDARTKVNRTPLHVAAAEGHAHVVELLVRNGADVNAKDLLKMTALHWAVENHHRDVVELLVSHGADVHAFSKFDKSAFDIAVEKNSAEILVILREAMQNQVNANPGRTNPVTNPVTVPAPFIFTSGEVVNLASLVSTANTKTTSVLSAASGGAAERLPLPKKPGLEPMADDVGRSKEDTERQLLLRLHEANWRAQEYRRQLLKKEQEAEEYRLRLEAMVRRQQPGGADCPTAQERKRIGAPGPQPLKWNSRHWHHLLGIYDLALVSPFVRLAYIRSGESNVGS